MSLEACRNTAEKRRKGERWAFGMVDDKLVVVILKRSIFSMFLIKKWSVLVLAYGEVSRKHFRRKDAERYFDDLTQKYGLKEEG